MVSDIHLSATDLAQLSTTEKGEKLFKTVPAILKFLAEILKSSITCFMLGIQTLTGETITHQHSKHCG